MPSTHATHFTLEPGVTFLNHGSYGACPRAVQEAQARYRQQMESQPVRFFVRELPGLLESARQLLATFLHADPLGLVFVPNATTGVNAALRSFPFRRGDRILIHDQIYNACRNAVSAIAAERGLEIDCVALPFPITDEGQLVEAIEDAIRPTTRLALLDHITSPTAMVFPIAMLVERLRHHGVETLVDGAHAPGQVELDLQALGAAFYTGNCHKWMFAPKGAAFLYVRDDLWANTRPLVVSHGANQAVPEGRPKMLQEFDWTGTADFTPYLCLPEAIQFGASLFAGGWPALQRHNLALAQRARQTLADELSLPLPYPAALCGAMATLRLPDATHKQPPAERALAPLQDELWERFRVEVPIIPFPCWPHRLLRISAQVYNAIEDYRRLGAALRDCVHLGRAFTSPAAQ